MGGTVIGTGGIAATTIVIDAIALRIGDASA